MQRIYKRAKFTLSSRGQTALEYVLLLFIAMVLVTFVLYKFNRPFRAFAQQYFGSGGYIECLLETGELPTLGSSQESANCAVPTIGEGDEPKILALEPNTSDRSPSVSGSIKPTKENSDTGSGRRDGSPSQLAENSAGGSSIPIGKYDPQFSNQSDSSSSSRGKIPLSKADVGDGRGINNTGAIADQSGAGGDSGRASQVELLASERAGVTTKKGNVPATEEDIKNEARRVPADFDSRKKKKSDTTDMDFTLGDFLKILLIIGILLALFVFLGGQALQISKSREK